MTAPLSAQRVEELREHLMFLGAEGISCSKQPCPYCADLLDILSAYEKMRADWDKIPELRADKIRYKIRAEQAEAQLAAMRAENELLNNNAMNDYAAHLELKARAEKSEAQLAAMRAENERLRAEFSTLKKAYDDECAWRGRGYRDLLTRAEKAEAQLEKQRPLVEAVMGMSIKTLRLWRGLHGPDGEMESFLRAALKYREEEGK
jgi:predicted RNase H-like nuclease (RuvC/YqgF family)